MNAIERYQEVLDTMIVGNRTGIYLSKEELQELIDYVNAAESVGFAWEQSDPDPENKLREAQKKLGLTK